MNPSRYYFLVFCLLIISSTGCKKTKPEKNENFVFVRSHNVSFKYSSKFFKGWSVTQEDRLTMQDVGDGVPQGVAPAHYRWIISPRESKTWPRSALKSLGNAHIAVIPLHDASVKDYSKAYPGISNDFQELLSAKSGKFQKVKPGESLPDWDCVDMHQTIHAKARTVSTPWGYGIEFITQYTQEESGIDNQGLTYVFEGISHDSKYLIMARIPIAHPSLPLNAPYYDQFKDEPYATYMARVAMEYQKIEKALDLQPDQTFYPPIDNLKDIINSITILKK